MSHDESKNDELYIPTETGKESVLIFNNKAINILLINNKWAEKTSRFVKPIKGRKFTKKLGILQFWFDLTSSKLFTAGDIQIFDK